MARETPQAPIALPKSPQAERIDLVNDEMVGLS